MESEEDARKFSTACDDMGSKVQVFGNVTLQYMDKEDIANTIDSFIAWSVLDGTSAAAYAASQRDVDLLIDYIPE